MFVGQCTVFTLTTVLAIRKGKQTAAGHAHPTTLTSVAAPLSTTNARGSRTTAAVAPSFTVAVDSTSESASSPVATSVVPSGSSPNNPFKDDMLKGHNFYRAQHSTSDLIWDEVVAASAQAKADKCVFAHDGTRQYGENLAIYSGSHQVADIIDMWGQERKVYDWNNPGFSMQTGHFTQMVWKGTSKLGCAVTNCGGSLGKLYVCHFDGPGNYIGEFPENVAKQSAGSLGDTYATAKGGQ